ncbi:MAG: type II toxin-antitoxin system RelE/ParE family toxin [Rhizobiaceae bacterium]
MWTIEIDDAAAREIRSFPDDLKGYVAKIFSLITEDGPQDLPPGFSRQIDGKLWELRLKARSGIGRALYFTINPKRLIVVSAFVKKSQKLPDHERQKAKARMNARLKLETARKEGKQNEIR